MKPQKSSKTPEFKFISKTIFFPKQGILAIGDLHLGYEQMLKSQGIFLPFNQLEETKKEIEIILKRVKALYKLNKIILLGDIKHYFSFDKDEIFEVRDFLRFLEKFLEKENIILIKGNHDTFTLKNYELKDFYIQENLAFTHGDKWFKELNDKKIKIVIIGHLHPSVKLKDKKGIKSEKYKAFLIGNFKKKKLIIVPSFLPLTEGSEVENLGIRKESDQIISIKQLMQFEAFLVEKNKVYDFGKVKYIN
ncbi:MAG: metallophosphoesterase [Candidatus Pacearchaeota archaeon]|jgi:hypothetical protein